MSLVKLSNNGVKNITSVGNVGTGDLVFISKQTASSSASISFTSGIDSTYKEYIFYFNNIHAQNNDSQFKFNMSTDGGSNYNVTKTTTFFYAYHYENDSDANLTYVTGGDLAQSTNAQPLSYGQGNENDESCSGYLRLFNPSSTTFVKHFISETQTVISSNQTDRCFVAGYCNVTAAIDGVDFKFSSGNIDSGVIKMYGVTK